MNRLSPLLVGDANYSHVLDLGMGAKNLLHFGWIDILPAADDHIALAIGEVIVAVLVATGHVTDRAVRALERFNGLLRQIPIPLERVRRAGIEFPDFTVDDLAAFRIKELDPPATEAFAAYGTELGQLLFWTQQSHPSRFGRAVGLVELRSPEIFHQRQLCVLARRRGGDEEFGNTLDIELALHRFG